MIFEQKLITPEIAADMLTRNDGNRPLRPQEVSDHLSNMIALERMRQKTGDKE